MCVFTLSAGEVVKPISYERYGSEDSKNVCVMGVKTMVFQAQSDNGRQHLNMSSLT